MKLHEKIKKLRQERGLSLSELHRLMLNDFEQETITFRSLQRIEAGHTDGRGFSLHQICTALGVTLSELKRDTEEETGPVDVIRKNRRLGKYVFSGEVYAELLTRQNRNFMVQELVLAPQGKTKLEQDPESSPDKPRFEKYVYCLKGQVGCFIGKDKYTLQKGDGLSFESAIPHWFENNSKSGARCLIFQNPRYL